MFITVSISDIIRRIYAESALRFATAKAGERPGLLIRDNEPALRRMTIDVFFEIVGSLARHVSDFGPEPAADDTEILYLEMDCAECTAAASLLATAVYGRLTSLVYADCSPASAASGLKISESAVEQLAGTTRAAVSCGRLRPGR